jgi:2-polyprenyl-3-methyl-5-hydroxy-6-metoxy-1,4-benzoquinol methylase
MTENGQARHATRQNFEPHAYWQERHVRHSGSLRSVGHSGLSEEENVQDYRVKASEILAALLESFPKPHGMSLLDAGCGTGYFSRIFSERGFTVAGVDFTEAGVEATKRRGISQVHLGDLATFALARQFDVVTCIDVLFHIVDDAAWEAAVRNLSRHVRHGGVLLLQDHLVERPVIPAKHVKFRSRDAYVQCLSGCGLQIVRERQYLLPAEQIDKHIVLGMRRVPDTTMPRAFAWRSSANERKK